MGTSKIITTWVVAVIAVVMFMFIAQKCSAQTKAQYDTIRCETSCIKRFASEQTKSGKTKIFAVYADEKNNILDLIPVSESVYNYIKLCRTNGIQPSLGIKLRNGEISSLIKIKPKYIKRK